MTESLLYMAIGFLAAALLAIAIVPLIHQRAVRLTMREVESRLPLSMAEVQAEKDALRADFAMTTRRLELANERLRNHIAQLMVRVSRRDDQLRILRSQFRRQDNREPARSSQNKNDGKRAWANRRDAAA